MSSGMENESVHFESGPSSDARTIRSASSSATWRRTSTCANRASSPTLMQRRLATMHPGPSRGVKQAGFRVLVTAYMPAVLVEIGFGTNAEEARFISSAAASSAIAAAIADAAVEYLEQARAPRRGGRRRRDGVARAPAPAAPDRVGPLAVDVAGLDFQNPDRARLRHRRLRCASSPASCDLERARRARHEGGERSSRGTARRRRASAEFAGRDDQRRRAREPGLDAVRREHLPWLAAHLPAARA